MSTPVEREHPRPVGLYLHVPFCEARCTYCSFVTWTDKAGRMGEYLEALQREIEHRLPGHELDTVYLGGGTPSLLPPGALDRLLSAVRDAADVTAGAEVTLEANPESVDAQRADRWREAGIVRASLGVQSFDDGVLERAGRLHSAHGASEAMRCLRAAGIANVSIDLIGGLPGETHASFRASLAEGIALEPDHVSLYLLDLDAEGVSSPLSADVRAGRVSVASGDELADRYGDAVEALEAAGLRRYEISSFARPDRESRHNVKYWRCAPTLGAGVGAHWFIDGVRRFNTGSLDAYLALVAERGDGEAEESRRSPPADVAQEELWLGLRLREGVSLAALEARHPGLRDRFRTVLDEHERGGLLRRHGGGPGDVVQLTGRGVLLSNSVFRDLLDA